MILSNDKSYNNDKKLEKTITLSNKHLLNRLVLNF